MKKEKNGPVCTIASFGRVVQAISPGVGSIVLALADKQKMTKQHTTYLREDTKHQAWPDLLVKQFPTVLSRKGATGQAKSNSCIKFLIVL